MSPREWWIAKTKMPGSFSKPGGRGCWVTPISNHRQDLKLKHGDLARSAVHVIEYAAYLALKLEYEALIDELSRVKNERR